jgi:putative transcriptional regulator
MNKTSISAKTAKRLLRPLTRKQIEASAKDDADNQPLSDSDFARMKRTPQVKVIRRALGISQEDFASRYHIPIGTLRDWEQGRGEPDQAARAYLTVIARDPEGVRQAFRAAFRSRR